MPESGIFSISVFNKIKNVTEFIGTRGKFYERLAFFRFVL